MICDAVHALSVREHRLQSIRQVVVAGLETILRASGFERFLLLKRVAKGSYKGTIVIYVAFGDDEYRLVQEVRLLLSSQTLDTLSTSDIMILAIYAVASP